MVPRAITDEVRSILMVDIAHLWGLVATKQHLAPFEHCDVVTTTTHKSVRGLRTRIASGGTDNHLVLWVLRPHGLTGSKVEKVGEAASISLIRNTVPGDASALSPGGVRIGAPGSRLCSFLNSFQLPTSPTR